MTYIPTKAPKLTGVKTTGKIDLSQVKQRPKHSNKEPQDVFITKGWKNHGIRKCLAYQSGAYWYSKTLGRVEANEVHMTYDEAYNRASRLLNALKAQYDNYDELPYWVSQITFCHPDYK